MASLSEAAIGDSLGNSIGFFNEDFTTDATGDSYPNLVLTSTWY